MRPDTACEEARAGLAEVALGIADGEERDRVLEHVAHCADCRLDLESQSTVADELLALAPATEPPLGFELDALRAIQPVPERGWSVLRWLAPAVAALAAIAVTAGAMLATFDDERRLADHYRATLAQANGTYFGAVRLADPAGRQGGVLFTYRGSPSWVLVTVAPEHEGSIERAEVVSGDGRRIPVPAFGLVDGVWGGALPLDLAEVDALELLSSDGRSQLVARL
jgi:hypothetical protein